MPANAINIIIVLLLLFFLYVGYRTGLIKSLFAVSAGFFALVLAENYPHQEGINYYFVFIATVVIIVILGMIILKIIKFLYLSLVDKTAGACLGLFLGFLLVSNFVIPTADKIVNIFTGIKNTETEITAKISKLSSENFPAFGSYVPNILKDKRLDDVSKLISDSVRNLKNFNKIRGLED